MTKRKIKPSNKHTRSELSSDFSRAVPISIAKNGRVVIPVDFRDKLGIKDGAAATITIVEGELRIIPGAQALKRLQELVALKVPKGKSLARELIEERKQDNE